MRVSFPTVEVARMSQPFNKQNPSLYGGDGRHKGIDYAVPVNSPVYACMDGVVYFAGVVPTGYGRHIKISHPDGSISIYGHLNSMEVSRGDTVSVGQKIGLSGGDKTDDVDGDGNSTGAHLHFEIRPKGSTLTDQTAVDPIEYLLRYVPASGSIGKVTASIGLSVRSQPTTKGRLLYYLFYNDSVRIVEEVSGWGRLDTIRPEWVYLQYIKKTGALFVRQLEPETETVSEPSIEEKVKILWDDYKARKGTS